MRRPFAVVLSLAVALVAPPVVSAADATRSARLPKEDVDLLGYFASFYRPVKVKVTAKAPQYKLPLDLGKVTNADDARRWLQRATGLDKLLRQNGFGATPGRHDNVVTFYKQLQSQGVPIFITSDSLLHLYHVQFGETLKGIEEREFFEDALALSVGLQTRSETLYRTLSSEDKEAARRCVAYFAVPVQLLSRNTLKDDIAKAVEHVQSWQTKRSWRQANEFKQKFGDLVDELSRRKLITPRDHYSKDRMLNGLRKLASQAEAAAKAAPDVPAAVRDDVEKELERIAAHEGFAESSVFNYREDYSQYVPRGHYTRSPRLKKYFRALMWYGRLTFLIKGRRPGSADRALVSAEEARIQTKAAAMITSMLGTTALKDGRTARAVWARMYKVTAYYVGLADDLTPHEYAQAMNATWGAPFAVAEMSKPERWFEFRKRLAKMRPPRIYSGTGQQAGPPAAIANEDTLMKALDQSQGLRLMGQRYIPDSYMMGRLVYPTVGRYTGGGTPFTLVRSDGGPVRGFPRGLDVLAVLGSDRARAILEQLGDDEYQRYDETLAKLRKEFGGLSQSDWNRNLYWSWLYALKGLLAKPGGGVPTFMQTDAWADKQVNAALGSWAQLRHDTILYAKQSYTMRVKSVPMRPKMVEGYIEPVPEFYARLLALTRMTQQGLGQMKVLDDPATKRLASLEQIIERLLKLSLAELRNEKLTDKDYAFIRSFGDRLKGAVAGVATDGLETTIIADVHTDQNSKQVLEEGTGRLQAMYVAYPMPDGGVVIGCGPAFSYYEFKHPMRDRLTDEAWKKMLRPGRKPSDGPELPSWTRTFSTGSSPAAPSRSSGRRSRR
jgi:hypothetical protein